MAHVATDMQDNKIVLCHTFFSEIYQEIYEFKSWYYDAFFKLQFIQSCCICHDEVLYKSHAFLQYYKTTDPPIALTALKI